MQCRVRDLRCKEVINICDGCRLGFVGDVEVNTCDGKIVNIVVLGRPKCFGLFGKYDDIILPWSCIEVIGRDAMLVNFEPPQNGRRKKSFFSSAFSGTYTN